METPVSTITSTGDLGGHKVQMGIDASAMAHIMSILTDLYSDPQGAVIREYSTNARDAHIEAGKANVPIEIITPNAFSPYFQVIDHGIGLSESDIEDMYSKYGASTKRGTNEQTGMLGLGAKSALTLVPQFNMESVKDGKRIYVSISRNSAGAGQMEILMTEDTTDANGVTIKIPVPRNNTFAQKVKDFFRFWEPGTVLIDGKEPEFVTGRPVGDKFILNPDLRQDYIVMGNVAYPVENGLWDGGYSYNKLGIVAKVNIGDVNFTPSREALQYTPQTKATIAAIKKEFADLLHASIEKDIADSKTYADAWAKSKVWRSSFGNRLRDLKYKGVQIPGDTIPFGTFKADRDNGTFYDKDISGKEFSLLAGTSGRYSSYSRGVNAGSIGNTLYVVNFPDHLKMSPIQREKAAVYCQQKNISATKAVITSQPYFINDADHLKFLEAMNVADWAVINEIKIQRNVSTNRIIRTEPYDLFDGKYSTAQVRTFDTTKPILYFSTAELKYPTWLTEMFPTAQIVVLPKNRWDKFIRDWPTAKHWRTAVVEHKEALVKQFTPEDKLLWKHDNWRWNVEYLDPDKIDDPDLKFFVKTLKEVRKYSPAAQQVADMSGEAGKIHVKVDSMDNPLHKYPLSGSLSRAKDDMDHVYWYLNQYYSYLTSNT